MTARPLKRGTRRPPLGRVVVLVVALVVAACSSDGETPADVTAPSSTTTTTAEPPAEPEPAPESIDEPPPAGDTVDDSPLEPVIPADFDPTGDDVARVYLELHRAYRRALAQRSTAELDLLVTEDSPWRDYLLDQIWIDERAEQDESARVFTIDSAVLFDRPSEDRAMVFAQTTDIGTTIITDRGSGAVIDETQRETEGGVGLHLVTLERRDDGSWLVVDWTGHAPGAFGAEETALPPPEELVVRGTGRLQGFDYEIATWEPGDGRICLVGRVVEMSAAIRCTPADRVEILLDEGLALSWWSMRIVGTPFEMVLVIAGRNLDAVELEGPKVDDPVTLHAADGVQVGLHIADGGESRVVLVGPNGRSEGEPFGVLEVPCGEWVPYGPDPFDEGEGSLAFDPLDDATLEAAIEETFDEWYRFGELATLRRLGDDELPEGLVLDPSAPTPNDRYLVEWADTRRDVALERWVIEGAAAEIPGRWDASAHHQYRECR